MSRILSALASATFLMSFAAAPLPSVAAQDPNIMIMGEDADRDTIPCNSRVFKSVLGAVVNQLNEQGFNVFDETAVTMDNFVQGRCRRADAELIDIVRTVNRPPIDIAVLIQMYSTVRELSWTARVRARISGRLLNVKTGQKLGNFEVNSPKGWNMQVHCSKNRDCLLEELAKHGRILANDLGAVLAAKLDALTKGPEAKVTSASTAGSGTCLPNAYTLIFDGYTSEDMKLAEEYFVAFSAYQKHRATSVSPRRRQYWYQSCIDSGRLARNLHEMIKFMNMPSTVNFSQARNTFTLHKISCLSLKVIRR